MLSPFHNKQEFFMSQQILEENNAELSRFCRAIHENFPHWHIEQKCFLMDCVEFHLKINSITDQKEKNAAAEDFSNFVLDYLEANSAREEYYEKFRQRLELKSQEAEETIVILI
jgi:hypothetical protein